MTSRSVRESRGSLGNMLWRSLLERAAVSRIKPTQTDISQVARLYVLAKIAADSAIRGSRSATERKRSQRARAKAQKINKVEVDMLKLSRDLYLLALFGLVSVISGKEEKCHLELETILGTIDFSDLGLPGKYGGRFKLSARRINAESLKREKNRAINALAERGIAQVVFKSSSNEPIFGRFIAQLIEEDRLISLLRKLIVSVQANLLVLWDFRDLSQRKAQGMLRGARENVHNDATNLSGDLARIETVPALSQDKLVTFITKAVRE